MKLWISTLILGLGLGLQAQAGSQTVQIDMDLLNDSMSRCHQGPIDDCWAEALKVSLLGHCEGEAPDYPDCGDDESETTPENPNEGDKGETEPCQGECPDYPNSTQYGVSSAVILCNGECPDYPDSANNLKFLSATQSGIILCNGECPDYPDGESNSLSNDLLAPLSTECHIDGPDDRSCD